MPLQKLQQTPAKRVMVSPPRSRAFFLELLLNMLIFALCAVVALQVFVEGKVSTDESAALSELVLQAESLAESYKTTDGTLEGLQQIQAGEGVVKDGILTYYYDGNLDVSTAEDARYALTVDTGANPDSLVSSVEIRALEGETELFSFEVVNYQPQGRG